MAAPLEGLPLDLLSLVAILLGLLFSTAILIRFGKPERLYQRLTARFAYGVPWGTVIVLGWVLVVYYFVQGGLHHPYDPVVVAFRSWSYYYPTGMFFAPFGHSGMGHLTGNLLAAVVFAPIAEYAWGHYRRPDASMGPPWLAGPRRRVAVFVGAVIGVGLLTSLFVPGPLIGFSGVVFAFAGFALVTFPIVTILAVVGSQILRLAYYSLLSPIVTAEAQQQFVSPFWAEIAIQAHVLGLLVGVVLGLAVHRSRETHPRATHVWFAGATYAVSESLYALYWYDGANSFVMYRGVGLGIVLIFAGLIPLATMRSERALIPEAVRKPVAGVLPMPDVPRRTTVFAILLVPILAIGMAAVPFKAADLDRTGTPEGGIEVEDYTISYAENVVNRNLAAVSVPFLRDSFEVTASGVIVSSPTRDVWEEVVPARQLAFDGRATVTVGGIGWRESIAVNRTAWTVVDGGSTFTVYMRTDGGPRQRVYVDDPVSVPAILDGKRVSIQPSTTGYQIAVSRNNTTVATGPMPTSDEPVTIDDLRFNRSGQTLSVAYDRTRLQIARLKIQERPLE